MLSAVRKLPGRNRGLSGQPFGERMAERRCGQAASRFKAFHSMNSDTSDVCFYGAWLVGLGVGVNTKVLGFYFYV